MSKDSKITVETSKGRHTGLWYATSKQSPGVEGTGETAVDANINFLHKLGPVSVEVDFVVIND